MNGPRQLLGCSVERTRNDERPVCLLARGLARPSRQAGESAEAAGLGTARPRSPGLSAGRPSPGEDVASFPAFGQNRGRERRMPGAQRTGHWPKSWAVAPALTGQGASHPTLPVRLSASGPGKSWGSVRGMALKWGLLLPSCVTGASVSPSETRRPPEHLRRCRAVRREEPMQVGLRCVAGVPTGAEGVAGGAARGLVLEFFLPEHPLLPRLTGRRVAEGAGRPRL